MASEYDPDVALLLDHRRSRRWSSSRNNSIPGTHIPVPCSHSQLLHNSSAGTAILPANVSSEDNNSLCSSSNTICIPHGDRLKTQSGHHHLKEIPVFRNHGRNVGNKPAVGVGGNQRLITVIDEASV